MSTRIPFVDLAAQHASIEREVNEAVSRALSRTDWILGAEVAVFEEEFAAFCEANGAVGVDCGMSALELALRALGVGPGDEVITQANTFIATALAISSAGARPVLVDVDPSTYNIDVEAIAGAITPRTKAILPVHLYGQPADMDPICALAREHGLFVVEDACQAHGARYKGRRAGSFGDAAAFSFYPSKNLGAYGDGGMVVARRDDVLENVRLLRNYGSREKYVHETVGFNHRLDTIQAAILRVKLRRLDDWNAARRAHAARYSAGLAEISVVPPTVDATTEPVWHLYVVELDDRDAARAALAARDIDAGIHYPIPVHLQPAYAGLGYERGAFPVTEAAAERILSLPMYPELPEEAIDAVLDVIAELQPASEVVSAGR